jgi:hypothetical protein
MNILFLMGKTVTETSLITNSLIIYLDEYKHKELGTHIWVEPAWRLTKDKELITGSRPAQVDEKSEHQKVADLIRETLKDKKITSAFIGTFNDLYINFQYNIQIATFANDYSEELNYEDWHIEDYSKNLLIYGNCKKVESKKIKEEQ